MCQEQGEELSGGLVQGGIQESETLGFVVLDILDCIKGNVAIQ